MPIWSQRTKTTTRRELVLPYVNGSANTARVIETIHAARNALAEELNCKVGELRDNAVLMVADGDTLVVYFERQRAEVHG